MKIIQILNHHFIEKKVNYKKINIARMENNKMKMIIIIKIMIRIVLNKINL